MHPTIQDSRRNGAVLARDQARRTPCADVGCGTGRVAIRMPRFRSNKDGKRSAGICIYCKRIFRRRIGIAAEMRSGFTPKRFTGRSRSASPPHPSHSRHLIAPVDTEIYIRLSIQNILIILRPTRRRQRNPKDAARFSLIAIRVGDIDSPDEYRHHRFRALAPTSHCAMVACPLVMLPFLPGLRETRSGAAHSPAPEGVSTK